MDSERNELYERIPWETLEQRGGDRQWVVIAVAGAVAIGALAFSFMRGQPSVQETPPQAMSTAPAPAVMEPELGPTATPTTSVPADAAASVPAAPVVVSEADLYAVAPAGVADRVAAYAEWFAVEFLAVDGSEAARASLAAMLPEGIPLPEPPAGTQVFVDWVRALQVNEIGPGSFHVEVLARSLATHAGSEFVRQPVTLLTVPIEIGTDGLPQVSGAPQMDPPPSPTARAVALQPVPETIELEAGAGPGSIVGGIPQADGSWLVVVMRPGPDRVLRPVAVTVP